MKDFIFVIQVIGLKPAGLTVLICVLQQCGGIQHGRRVWGGVEAIPEPMKICHKTKLNNNNNKGDGSYL